VADSAYDLGVVLWQTSSAASPQKLAEAERLFREALGIRQTLFGRGREVACCFGYLGMALADQGKLGEAEKMFRQALQALGPNESGDSPETALALCYLGRLVAKRGALQEAENLQRRALAIRRSVLGTNDDAFGESLVDLANVLASEGKQAESEALQDEALALVNKLSARKRPWPSNFAAGLGFLYRNQGKLAKAETSFRAEVANRRKLYGPDHGATERSIEMLTSVLLGEGKLAEAAQVLGAEIERRRKFQPTVGFADALDFLSRVLRANGDIDTAQARHREAMRIRANLNEIGKTDDMNAFAWAIARSDDATPAEATRAVEVANKAVATTNRKDAALLDTLAAALARHGDFRQAVAVQEEAIRQLTNPALKSDFTSRLNLYTAGKPYTDEVELAQLLASCTSGLLSEGKFIEAESPGRRCLALREKDLPDDWRTFNSRSMLGGALLGQKKYAEAEPLLLSGCKGMKERENKMPAGAQQWLKEARQRLVELYEATGKPEEAAKWKGE
jgi:tetratricopeptide (TPR) repeat protein